MRSAFAMALAAVLFALPGCGFHLQGVTRLPPELSAIYLQVPDPASDLAFQLRRSLAASGVTVVDRPDQATAVLSVPAENYGRRIKSVSAQNRPTEFEIYYEAEYRLQADGEVLLPRQEVARSRIVPYSERDILGKQQEQAMLRDAMAREIAGVITRRLADLGQ